MSDYRPCPSCPDGNEWSANGTTGRACRTCGGFAVLHTDGSKMTRAEFNALTDYSAQEAVEAERDALRLQLSAMTRWLELNEPSVWRRGLWDAIGETTDAALREGGK